MKLQELKNKIEELTEIKDISIKTRKRDYVIARSIFFDLAYRNTTLTYEKIGCFLGMDHASVIYGMKMLKSHLKYEPRYRPIYDQLVSEFKDDEIDMFIERIEHWISSIPVRKHEEILKKLKRIEI